MNKLAIIGIIAVVLAGIAFTISYNLEYTEIMPVEDDSVIDEENTPEGKKISLKLNESISMKSNP